MRIHNQSYLFMAAWLLGCGGSGPKPVTTAVVPDITFTDVDGNIYRAKKLGSRYWMTTNFKASRTPGGEAMPGILVYDNDPGKRLSYGGLYTWPAALQAAPLGWRLPTAEDWQELISLHGGASVAGGQMKETGTSHWLSPNAGATNTLGFAAVGGGFRGGDGVFRDLGQHGTYWGITNQSRDPYCVYLYNSHSGVASDSSPEDKTSGIAFAIRYVRD